MTRHVTVATWDDPCPHLTEEMKKEYFEKIPPHLRDVRTKGMPTFGAGLVWPVDLAMVSIPPFSIPNEYYRSYALDTGWNWNGVVFFAEDRTDKVVYIYDVFKRSQVEPPVIAEGIKSRGKWMGGVADAADINRSDGKQYIEIYKALGLDIELPNKAIETGINLVWHLLTTGKLRVFSTCTAWFDEARIYMRDGNGKIKEGQDDHLMDGTRHGCLSALQRGRQPPKIQVPSMDWNSRPGGNYGWMA